ncbi:MAG: hypothetical protein PUB32_05300 [Clostridiales bacterium]|nr:hypothetical protein [Clostridiales bacterium]
METLKKLFPFSFREASVNNLVVSIIVYIVVSVVVGLVLGLLAKIPLIGWIFSIVRTLVALYCLIGIALAVLYFLKVIK